MIFRYIILSLSQSYDDFPKEIGYPFRLKSYSLCNFIERKIAKIRYETEGFNQLSIRGFKGKAFTNEYINDNKVLCIYMDNFDYSSYEKIDQTDIVALNEYYIDLLMRGLQFAKKYDLPEKEIIEAIDEFRKNNYINAWFYKKKRIVGKKSYCFIECEITVNELRLSLVIEREDIEVYREIILEDLPDCITTSYHFGDLKVSRDGVITVTDRLKKVLLEFDSNTVLS